MSHGGAFIKTADLYHHPSSKNFTKVGSGQSMAAMNDNEHTTRAVHSAKRDSNLNALRKSEALADGAVAMRP